MSRCIHRKIIGTYVGIWERWHLASSPQDAGAPVLRKSYIIIVILASVLAIMTGCLDDIRYNMPCRIPDEVQREDIIGTWQLMYHNYGNPYDSSATKITGTEIIVFNEDGTYVQTFRSPEFEYIGPESRWKLITTEGDGPKLEMYDLKYFANGIENSGDNLLLSLQTPDRLEYKQKYTQAQQDATIVIQYPSAGYVYLYPRSCLWKFVLLQMASGTTDPDDLTVHHPVFTKVR